MRKVKKHYVNNKDLFTAMVEWKTLCSNAEKEGKEKVQIPNYIGECILKIANKLSNKPNFMNYTYKEDMISDGIENCIQYIGNFNPEKSQNPFAYFTQIIYFAFLRRIQKEKKQVHVKNKMIEKRVFQSFSVMKGDDTQYAPQGFEPSIMLPTEDVYKPKVKKNNKKKNNNPFEMDLCVV